MKIITSYIPEFNTNLVPAAPVSPKNFVSANRLIEAWRYLQNLRYTNLGHLFNDSIANAIESTTFTSGNIKANVSDFYGALEMNILSDLESMFGLERGLLVDLNNIRWYRLTCTIVSTEDPNFIDHTPTTEIVEVLNTSYECYKIIGDLIEDDRQRIADDLESQKK